jgi:hypothetical protein
MSTPPGQAEAFTAVARGVGEIIARKNGVRLIRFKYLEVYEKFQTPQNFSNISYRF